VGLVIVPEFSLGWTVFVMQMHYGAGRTDTWCASSGRGSSSSASATFTACVTSRPTRRIQTAMMAGILLLVTGAAATSAASVGSALFQHARADPAGVTLGSGHRYSLDLALGSLMPGETIRARRLVTNEAGLAVRYALSSASADDDHAGLRDLLAVTVRTADLGSGVAGSCTAFDGRTLYDGRLGADAAGFGDARMGDQTGDRVLAPGGREALCFELRMGLDAGNEIQGSGTSTIWTIALEQVAGNP
jgi:hypothetical protein